MALLGQARTVIAVGASVRALAASALRAGLAPWCIDLFADRDLAAIAPVQRCPTADYPAALISMVQDRPAAAVIYTGGLENHPAVVEAIGTLRPLWGCDSESLRLVRDPLHVARILRDFGLPHPRIADGRGPPGRRYLRKPLRGAAGHGIDFAAPDAAAPAGCYHQEFIAGQPHAAIFAAQDGRTDLLGVTMQLIGETWLSAKPFQYCGSIGPISLSDLATEILVRIGRAVAEVCGLRGLFGIDFILRDDMPWPVEVNPRYTASVEVLEFGLGFAALSRHVQAFAEEPPPSREPSRMAPFVGKAIVFAAEPLSTPDSWPWPITLDPFALPVLADVPHPRETIDIGSPILTVFAAGDSMEMCRESLRQRAETINQWLRSRACRTPARP